MAIEYAAIAKAALVVLKAWRDWRAKRHERKIDKLNKELGRTLERYYKAQGR